MNLYIESLAGYLIAEWDRILNAADGPREARFIVESLGPDATFVLFDALERHLQSRSAGDNIERYFKVATGLWRDWLKTEAAYELDQVMDRLKALGPNGERRWIDEEDQLTLYRNCTRSPDKDGLAVVLLGFNHATDQGGLSDFHQVDEARIWRDALEQGFMPWLQRVSERLGLGLEERTLKNFEPALRQLFEVRPLRLGKLADFIEMLLAQGSCHRFDEFTQRFFRNLHWWGIPPMFPETAGAELHGKKGAARLKEAEAFISHQRYKTPGGRKKDWEKILPALEADGFVLPETLDEETAYVDIADFRDTLDRFIQQADAQARARLLRTDLLPLLKILKPKKSDADDDDKPPKTPGIPGFTGGSFEAVLEGVWRALREFAKAGQGRPLYERLGAVRVELVRFEHDMTADDDTGAGASILARELLKGCLGGLDELFATLDLRLPIDEEQAVRPRSEWTRTVPCVLALDFDAVTLGVRRARPAAQFRVILTSDSGEAGRPFVFKWVLASTHPERVRFECLKRVRARWEQTAAPAQCLPAFRISAVHMAALYFAADSDEANRLMTQAMSDLSLLNLLAGLPMTAVDPLLWGRMTDQHDGLIATYRRWLDAVATQGYYRAQSAFLPPMLAAFDRLAEEVLDTQRLGGTELLRRLYKAFLVVDERAQSNDRYLPAAVLWGLSPAVLELTQARARFLADGFPEAVGTLALGREARTTFERLLNLAEIQRPLAALVVDAQGVLSTAIKSFDLLHYLGSEPAAGRTLAVQTLLREEDGEDDEEEVREIQRHCEERDLVVDVLRRYLQLYPFAADGLRILAVNVCDLQAILAGVETFVAEYLKDASPDWPPFQCMVMVYSTSSSPMAMENRLALWRDLVMERQRENGRPLLLSVGHRYAPKEQIVALLEKERRGYDIAFLFHFLRASLTGRAVAALPFEFGFSGWSGLQFPIAEYPLPILEGDRYRRRSLLSNRRLRVQTRHADLSARLCYDSPTDRDHVVHGEVDYWTWAAQVEALHRRAQWVACIDPFVDKRLLCEGQEREPRKIVGFTSGLGDYGELNLTISTERDTLEHLACEVAGRLNGLLPFAQPDGFVAMGRRIVAESEEIIGLSALRAVLGDDERIRDLVSFAAVARALAPAAGAMSQLVPIDALPHWFNGGEVARRPDLLRLTLEVRPGAALPLVRAVLIECKLAQQNPMYLAQATEQIQEGLRHLSGLLAPRRADLLRIGFDRRYWWAQLHRAITSRSVVRLPTQERKALEQALERLAEGHFEIHWQVAILTFWTNEPGPQPIIDSLALPPDSVQSSFAIPPGFAIVHLALGYEGLCALFAATRPQPLLCLDGPAIVLAPVAEYAPAAPLRAAPDDVEPPLESGTSAGPESPVSIAPGRFDPPPTAPTVAPPQSDPPLTAPAAAPPQSDPPLTAPAAAPPPLIQPACPIPERILLGTRANGEPVYWHFGHPQLPNRHLLVFGVAGSGKTYAIQCLLAELARANLHSLVVDYTDGFLPKQVESEFAPLISTHFIAEEPLPLDPFRPQRQVIHESLTVEETPYLLATRVATIFSSVFDMGDQQFAALVRAIQTGIESNPRFALDDLLSGLRDEGTHGQSLANKLEPLIQSKPFRAGEESAWKGMLSMPDRQVQILQLKGRAREIQRMITEFVLWDLWDHVQNTGSKYRPIPVVLDEIQNLDHRSDSPIDKMIREGRKFGLGMILATQTTSQFNAEQRDRLFQAGHKLFFKPATTEIDRFSQLLAQSPGGTPKAAWAQRLASLEKGQCWSLGWVRKSGGGFKEEAVLISVTSLAERGFAPGESR